MYFLTTIPTNQCFSVYAERKGDGNVMGFEGITFTLVETSVPINIAMLLNFFSPKICHFFVYSSSTFFVGKSTFPSFLLLSAFRQRISVD